jgi:hypothetical protein
MIWLIGYVVTGLISLLILWVLFLAVMCLKDARDAGRLSPLATRLGNVLLAFGYFWDFGWNALFATVLFLDAPREFTLSARLQRYVDGPDGWRRRRAIWFAINLLNGCSAGGPHIRI